MRPEAMGALVSSPCCRAHSGVSQSGAGWNALRGRGLIGRSVVGAEGEVSHSAREGVGFLMLDMVIGSGVTKGVGALLIP